MRIFIWVTISFGHILMDTDIFLKRLMGHNLFAFIFPFRKFHFSINSFENLKLTVSF